MSALSRRSVPAARAWPNPVRATRMPSRTTLPHAPASAFASVSHSAVMWAGKAAVASANDSEQAVRTSSRSATAASAGPSGWYSWSSPSRETFRFRRNARKGLWNCVAPSPTPRSSSGPSSAHAASTEAEASPTPETASSAALASSDGRFSARFRSTGRNTCACAAAGSFAEASTSGHPAYASGRLSRSFPAMASLEPLRFSSTVIDSGSDRGRIARSTTSKTATSVSDHWSPSLEGIFT